MIKHRTMKPPVGTARSRVSQYPIARLRYMRYHSTMNGTTELKICHTLRHVSGYAYLETIPCHLNFSLLIGTSDGWTLILLYRSVEIKVNLRGFLESNLRLR